MSSTGTHHVKPRHRLAPRNVFLVLLATGIRTPIGIKLFGKDLSEMERLVRAIEQALKSVPGTTSTYAEHITGGYYLDIDPDYEALSRYGLPVAEILDLVATAIGGETLSTMVEGRERFGILLRYPRELRDNPEALASHVLVPTPGGAVLPLGQPARIGLSQGPPGIRTENAMRSTYIYVDMRGRDIAHYVEDAKQAVAWAVQFPPGYYITWSGQFEYMARAEQRLKLVVPLTPALIFVLLQVFTRNRLVMAVQRGSSFQQGSPDRHACGALHPGGRGVAGVAPGLQRQRGGGGGLHRTGRRGSRNGGVVLIYLDQALT